jgi:phosphoribosylformimino-5-aminoimidazole carboxamide ribotide isomerase
MIEIIPAIDLIDGKCVRLTHGDFSRKTVYSGDPVKTAKQFEAAGLKRLHVVDLDGARTGRPGNIDVLKRIADTTSLIIDYGGGLRTSNDIAEAFAAGASIINIGSLAAREPETFIGWLNLFGAEHMLLGADSREGFVAVDGWQTDTKISIFNYLAEMASQGVTSAFVTDIASDGALAGPATQLYRRIRSELPALGLIASGGVRSVADIDELDAIGCTGVIIGKALYEGNITPEDLAKYAG